LNQTKLKKLQANAKRMRGTDLSVVHQMYGWENCFTGGEYFFRQKQEWI